MAQNCRLWRGAYNAAARWLKLLQPVYFQKQIDKYLGFTKNISGSNCTGEKWKNRIIMPLRGDLNGSGVPWDGQEATLLPTLLAKFEKQQHLHSSSPHLPPPHDGDDKQLNSSTSWSLSYQQPELWQVLDSYSKHQKRTTSDFIFKSKRDQTCIVSHPAMLWKAYTSLDYMIKPCRNCFTCNWEWKSSSEQKQQQGNGLRRPQSPSHCWFWRQDSLSDHSYQRIFWTNSLKACHIPHENLECMLSVRDCQLFCIIIFKRTLPAPTTFFSKPCHPIDGTNKEVW